jgi:protocatechuate 3,4-dioxygenase beta subunit
MAIYRDSRKGLSSGSVTRRTVLQGFGTVLVAAPLVHLMGCSDDGGGGRRDAGEGNDAAPDAAASDARTDTGWATGGTASMSGDYPDPFTDDPGPACVLTCAQILGPCYAATMVRKDISEGEPGLPMRLALRVVDEACKPIEGAEVDIWHTMPDGHYSAEDADPFCTGDDAHAESGRFFRGIQVTDARGRVDFDSCFPGWYAGRAIHIHFTIRVGQAEYVTSQLYFEDALGDEIIATQPIYKDRGARDTTNQTDGVISPDAVGDYVLTGEQMPDGALLAWKTLVIRSSLDTALCDAPSGGLGGRPPAR